MIRDSWKLCKPTIHTPCTSIRHLYTHMVFMHTTQACASCMHTHNTYRHPHITNTYPPHITHRHHTMVSHAPMHTQDKHYICTHSYSPHTSYRYTQHSSHSDTPFAVEPEARSSHFKNQPEELTSSNASSDVFFKSHNHVSYQYCTKSMYLAAPKILQSEFSICGRHS